MNEFASALSATLHEKAQEIAMSTDMQHAERQFQESIRSVDRRRRVWIAAAAAAAILIMGVGITLGIKLPTSRPPQPAHPNPTSSQPATNPILFDAKHLPAPLTVRLPHWIASTKPFVGRWGAASAYAFELPNGGRDIHLISVRYMYPLGATKITQPSYAALVAHWKAVQPRGYGTVTDIATATVGGKPATTMTVAFTKRAPGLDHCDAATGVPTDSNGAPIVQTAPGWTLCGAPEAGRTYHLAIVNEGRALPPTVLWEASATNDSVSPSTASEFATWLATVRFN
jgi:hypothetical protein